MIIGDRVEHKDSTYAAYGTIVGHAPCGCCMYVLWDAVDEPAPDDEPDIVDKNDIEVIGS